jgi:uncharacterized protein YciI
MDGLADECFIAYGGPAGHDDQVVLVFDAPDEDTIRARLELDPWTRDGLLGIVAIEPWTIWLGGDEQLDPSRPLHLVSYAPGPRWNPTKSRRQQEAWDAHAEFMDALVAEGIVVMGGPLDDQRALLVMSHDDERALLARLDQDPWVNGVLIIERIEPWRVWLTRRATTA